MARISDLQGNLDYYTSLIEVLDSIKEPTKEQDCTIRQAKEDFGKKVSQIKADIDKHQKADERLKKHFYLIAALLVIMLMVSSVIFGLIIANRIGVGFALIPVLFLFVIQIAVILIVQLKPKSVILYLVFLALGIIAVSLAHFYYPASTGSSLFTIVLQFISVVSFIFTLYEKMKKKE